MEEWTTIDRKMSKKKTSRDEGKEEGDGWEQVNKKEKRKSVVSSVGQPGPGQEAHKGRNGGGQRGGGGRGRGRDSGADSGSNKGTLPRKNSSKPPRGGSQGGRGGGGRGGTQSPAGRGAGGSRGVTPQPQAGSRAHSSSQSPAPAPAPPNPNSWAAKLSGAKTQAPPPEPAQAAMAPTPKFSWASLSQSSSSSSTATAEKMEEPAPTSASTHSESNLVQSEEPITKTNDHKPPAGGENASEIDPSNEDNVKEEPQPSSSLVSAPAPIVVTSMQENDATIENPEQASDKVAESDDQVDEAKAKEALDLKPVDNGTDAVIGETDSNNVKPDSNGNFATDDNENITNLKSLAQKDEAVKDDASKPEDGVTKAEEVKPLTNGDIASEEEDGSKRDVLYKDDQWSPLNTDGKKQYDRDFLISLQTNPLSMQKPGTLPSNMEVILNAPNLDTIRNVTSAPNLKMFDSQQPFRSSASHQRGTPRRGDSRRKESNRQGPAKVITLQREEVKLREAGENAWKAGGKKEAGAQEDDLEALSKKVRSILNKLCPQKFDVLVAQFNDLVIDSEEKLAKAMELVFEKALDEPVFSVAYARMCQHLASKRVETEGRPPVNFRILLLQRCQAEFIKDYMEDLDRTKYVESLAKAENEEEKKNITAEFNAQEMKLRRRSLGNIRFIGELYRIKMLNGKIMHECIRKLLKETDEESMECLCRLVTTIGAILEEETKEVLKKNPDTSAAVSLDVYFDKMKEIIAERKASSRVRFLMQDVIDLRTANWVKRREEAGPKMIDQIHKDAKKEEIKIKLANIAEPPPSRKSEDRRRSQIARKESRPERGGEDTWNNVPTRAAKVVGEKVDISKISRLSSQYQDPANMSFGPPRLGPGGGMGTWGRGSGNKKLSMQIESSAPLKQVNRFAGLLDDDGDAMPPPASVYHGRASEPAVSLSRAMNGTREGDNSLRGGSRSRDNSRDNRGSYSGRSSRDSATGGGYSRRPQGEVITEDRASNVLQGVADRDREKLEDKTRTIIEEYLQILDIREAFTCICELFHVTNIHYLVEFVFNIVVEKKDKDRVNAGKLLGYLLKNETLPRKEFLNGVESVLEFAEDLLIDIPQFWGYFGAMIAIVFVERFLDLQFIQDSSAILRAKQLEGKYCSGILIEMGKLDASVTVELWKQSGLALSDFSLNQDDPKFEFLSKPLVNGVKTEDAVKTPEEVYIENLDAILSKHDVNSIFSFVEEKFGSNLENKDLRLLVSRVTLACVDSNKGDHVLNEQRLLNFGVKVMKKFLDSETETESNRKQLQALFSLQGLVTSLEHPNKLLHSIFEIIYDKDVVCEEAFLDWERNEDPEEQEGKGVALKSCTQFIKWLKEAEPEEEEDTEKQKATFTVGEAS